MYRSSIQQSWNAWNLTKIGKWLRLVAREFEMVLVAQLPSAWQEHKVFREVAWPCFANLHYVMRIVLDYERITPYQSGFQSFWTISIYFTWKHDVEAKESLNWCKLHKHA